jgi:hypothetical protein
MPSYFASYWFDGVLAALSKTPALEASETQADEASLRIDFPYLIANAAL